MDKLKAGIFLICAGAFLVEYSPLPLLGMIAAYAGIVLGCIEPAKWLATKLAHWVKANEEKADEEGTQDQ